MNANSMPASSGTHVRRQRHRHHRRLLFVAAASLLALQLGPSPSLAQQYPGGGAGAGAGGRDYDEYYSHEEYADRRYRPDSLYADYMHAASHQNAGGGGGGGGGALTKQKGALVKLALAFEGGWVGAKAHTFLKMRRTAPPRLRFRVGELVLCHMGSDQWMQGTVVKLWPQQGRGQYAPYLIRLDGRGGAETGSNKKKGGGGKSTKKKSWSSRGEGEGQIIYAPADHDGVIRAAAR